MGHKCTKHLTWAGWKYSYQRILIFELCHVNKWITAQCYTCVDCSGLQRFLPSTHGRGTWGEGLLKHSVHRCRTAVALQMHLMAQIIVSYGAILSFTALFKQMSRLAGNEPAHKCWRQWIKMRTSIVEDNPFCLSIILKWNKILLCTPYILWAG